MSKLSLLAVSIKDAAKLSGISRSQLYVLIKNGKLKIRKCGKRTLIRYVDLQELIDALPSGSDTSERLAR